MNEASRGAASRVLAARVVDRVVHEGETLDAALAAVMSDPRHDRDRARVQALAYGTLRSWHRLSFLRDALLDRPLKARDRILEALLAVGLFELTDSTHPDYAAVSAAVEACRALQRPQATGLVNGLLRRFQRESTALLAEADENLVARHSHPLWMIDALKAQWPDHWEGILAANQEHPPLWLRVNRRRSPADAAARAITAATGTAVATDPRLPDGLRLLEALPVARIAGFAEGQLSVQDGSAQYAAELVAAEPGHRVLDACAAPGGKTAHLLERAGGDLDLLALDVDGRRLERVRENLLRLGLRADVRTGDAGEPGGWWDGRPFQRVLVDAPCTGTGVIRRHPDIKLLRRSRDVAGLAAQQLRLLRSLWPLLAAGGRLVYATCSVLRNENEQVVDLFLREHSGVEVIDPPVLANHPEALRAGAGWQLLPGGGSGTDGFYYAVLAKVT